MTGLDAVEENVRVAALHASRDPSLRERLDLSSLPDLAQGLGVTTPRTLGGRGSSLRYRACAAEDLVKEGEKFDVVCAMEVLEHVEDPRGFLFSLAELTKVSAHFSSSFPLFTSRHADRAFPLFWHSPEAI